MLDTPQQAYLVLHLLHGLFVGLWNTSLMVTEDRHHAIRVIVSVEFLLDRRICWDALIELLLESDRSVVSTKNLRGKTLHVGV